MPRHRIALIGLGMAVTPHAKSLLDLEDRVEVAYAMSPSAARREAFAARFPFPTDGQPRRHPRGPQHRRRSPFSPRPTRISRSRAELAKAGKHILLEKPLEISTARAEQLVAACRDAGVTLGVVLQHRFKPAAERLAAILRAGALGEIVNCSTSIRLWRPQSYYDEPGRGTKARDGGGVLMTQGIHTLDLMLSLAGPIVEVSGYAAHLARASHGDRGPGVRGGALCQRRPRRHRRDHRRLSGLAGAHRADRHQGDGLARRHGAHRALSRRPAARSWRRTRRRAAPAPTRWPSRTTITSACGATSSMRSSAKRPPRVSGARR